MARRLRRGGRAENERAPPRMPARVARPWPERPGSEANTSGSVGSRDPAGRVGTLEQMSDPGAAPPPASRRQRRPARLRRRRRQRVFALAGAAVVAVATVAAWQLGGSGDDGAAAPA